MAENDIYDSRSRYEKFKVNLPTYLDQPTGKRKYQVKNETNLQYFHQLMDRFEAQDVSYIRRLRLLRSFLIVCHAIGRDLKEVDRYDIDKMVAFANQQNKVDKTKKDFITDIKHMWKIILPERDERNRIDDSIVPYAVRHLTSRIDKSREKMREDRLKYDEFEKLVAAFGTDARMQALLTVMMESLGRPQELLGRNIGDVEFYENYAKIYITQHGKEGVGFLRCIDSYYYLSKWLNEHPLKDDPQAPLFVNIGNKQRFDRLKPSAANKLIRDRLKIIGIEKPITLYSLKRNGVTLCRLRGDSDVDIQHRARWTSTRQLRTYDMSTQEDTFKLELVKRGIIKPDEKHPSTPTVAKRCWFCNNNNGIAQTICSQCKRPLDRMAIEKQESKRQAGIDSLKSELALLRSEQQKNQEINEFMLEMMQRLEKKKQLKQLAEAVSSSGLSRSLKAMNLKP